MTLTELLRAMTKDSIGHVAADFIEKQAAELEAARADIELERIRLAVCGVVAMANTMDSAVKAREMLPEYRSASLNDVIRAVDSEMSLRDRLAASQAENVRLREWQKKAAKLVKHADGCLWATPLPTGYGEWGCTCGYSDLVLDGEPLNATPSDTSALEAMISKAGEKMRERCRKHCVSDMKIRLGEEIRALPGVTLGDLK